MRFCTYLDSGVGWFGRDNASDDHAWARQDLGLGQYSVGFGSLLCSVSTTAVNHIIELVSQNRDTYCKYLSSRNALMAWQATCAGR